MSEISKTGAKEIMKNYVMLPKQFQILAKLLMYPAAIEYQKQNKPGVWLVSNGGKATYTLNEDFLSNIPENLATRLKPFLDKQNMNCEVFIYFDFPDNPPVFGFANFSEDIGIN
jgi:hypothetical protein